MNTRDIRETYTRFFEERGHRRFPSASLIPTDDPTLLFTSAGMVQFKSYFRGLATPPATRLTTVQKCFRTSDIEEVGDNRHCTFFEMMGNFSIGDYFKPEVIPWAWELLTAPQPQGMGLNKDRIWATIFETDDEAYELWRGVGIPDERIRRYGEEHNYWFAGPIGPCGPNTEINYDFGEYEGWEPHDCHPQCEVPNCRRFIELWNLVFMTLFQAEDGSRTPLTQRNIDTGAGLERWPLPVLWEQQVDWEGKPHVWKQPPTIFDVDLLRPLAQHVGRIVGKEYETASEEEQRAMRVVAEHARAATFLIADGVTPANDGRGYVLRRLIRRATSFGQRLASGVTFLESTAAAVIDQMQGEHPNLVEQRAFVLATLRAEESRFAETVVRGNEILRGMISYRRRHAWSLTEALRSLSETDVYPDNAASFLEAHGFTVTDPNATSAESIGQDLAASSLEQVLHSELVSELEEGEGDFQEVYDWVGALTSTEIFYLYDTYGFPPEMTREIALENGLTANQDSYETLMEEQRNRSRAATRFEGDGERIQVYGELGLSPTNFVGYESTISMAAVNAILINGSTIVRRLTPQMAARASRIEIVLDRTPFYAEGGGQVGDRGDLVWDGGLFHVTDTQHVGEGGVTVHFGELVEGEVGIGDIVEARVSEAFRGDTARNHTATHILHAALRQVVGSHVRQAGSLVTPDRLRFDFTHLEALTPDQIKTVELLANRAVRDNIPVNIEYQDYQDAIAGGALAFFGDKYADVVRVVGVCDADMGQCFSKELCGGTHVHASGDVGSIVVLGESSIGAGLRRIEALTGRAAAEHIREQENTVNRLSAALRIPPAEIETRVATLRDENDQLRRQLQTLERRLARAEAEAMMAGNSGSSDAAADDVTRIGETAVIVRRVDVTSADGLRSVGDVLKQKYSSAVILLASVINGAPQFLAMSTQDVTAKIPAGSVVSTAAKLAGGGGGGRPDIAQGAGKDPSKLEAALEAGRKLIEEKLSA